MASNRTKSIQQHFQVILLVAQCFGIFPVCGIAQKDPSKLKFSWKSKRTVYSIIVIFCLSFTTATSIVGVFHKTNLTKWTHFSFYASNLITAVLFLKLAKSWPKLMITWNKIENATGCFCTEKLSRKFNMICLFVMGCAFVEHILFELILTKDLYKTSNNITRFVQLLVLKENPSLTLAFPNTIVLGIFSKWIQILATFAWTFIDLFVILITVALADRFKQISTKIKKAHHAEMSKQFWQKIREEYGNLCELYEEIDNSISLITLLSFTSNLYFILNQLFRSIISRESVIGNVYFFSSFALVVIRIVCVCLFAAQVHKKSKQPLYYLIFSPSEVYCDEVERLMDQIHLRKIALTGHKLFSVTHRLIFKIAATIVTYELFLFQFNINTLLKQ